ncbi:hypothetical protein ROZALSC1DRAFT_23511, partial [Rozella allomycis CSF55]
IEIQKGAETAPLSKTIKFIEQVLLEEVQEYENNENGFHEFQDGCLKFCDSPFCMWFPSYENIFIIIPNSGMYPIMHDSLVSFPSFTTLLPNIGNDEDKIDVDLRNITRSPSLMSSPHEFLPLVAQGAQRRPFPGFLKP